jgi:hypothetical protein
MTLNPWTRIWNWHGLWILSWPTLTRMLQRMRAATFARVWRAESRTSGSLVGVSTTVTGAGFAKMRHVADAAMLNSED